MKAGKTLQELATELEKQKRERRDFIADTRSLQLVEEPDAPSHVRLQIDTGQGLERFNINRHAHSQIAARVGIPQKYYDRMLEQAPDLLATNVNGWFERGHMTRGGNWQADRRMVRTLNDNVRAFLSDRFKLMDNWEMLTAALPVLQQAAKQYGEIDFASCEVTDSRMYVKALFPFISDRVDIVPGAGHTFLKEGELQQAALVMSNSEVGAGRMLIEPSIFTYSCTNLAISSRTSLAKFHLGRAHDGSDEAYEIFSDDTLRMDDAALWGKVRDTVRASVDRVHFDRMVTEMKQAAARTIDQSPVEAVRVLAERNSLNEEEHDSVLQHLIRGGSLTQYGLQAAVTRASQDVASYDRATELERLGGALLEATDAEWRALAGAASN